MAISCRVTRGDLTESIHVAFGTAVDKNGQVFFSTGDPHYLTCIRSSLKPFQAAASIKSGAIDSANFCDKEIALMCASHQGEKDHINTAKSMLEKLNLLYLCQLNLHRLSQQFHHQLSNTKILHYYHYYTVQKQNHYRRSFRQCQKI